MHPYYIIAVDVSKDTLQIRTPEAEFALPYDRTGLRKLIKPLQNKLNPLVVMEATGGYERLLLETCREGQIACRLLNPARIRSFAASEGIKAKTDRIDAEVIYRFAQAKNIQPAEPISPQQRDLMDLMDRRTQLTAQLAREKNRREKAPSLTAKSIERMIKVVEREIQAIELAVRKLIAAHPLLQAKADIITSVIGAGDVTAWTLLAYLPEISSLERNRLVALAGVAPYNRDSGTASGKRSIFGGRAKVRRCLYMASHTAAIHNPVIKSYVNRLSTRGKAYKCAIVAAMRKMLIHIHSLLRKNIPSSLRSDTVAS
jgi:transposase